jgi:hypothetical protein
MGGEKLMSNTCDYEICTRKLESAYTPISIEIHVKNKQRVKPEKYKGKFCTWWCVGSQIDRWIQRSKHV